MAIWKLSSNVERSVCEGSTNMAAIEREERLGSQVAIV